MTEHHTDIDIVSISVFFSQFPSHTKLAWPTVSVNLYSVEFSENNPDSKKTKRCFSISKMSIFTEKWNMTILGKFFVLLLNFFVETRKSKAEKENKEN